MFPDSTPKNKSLKFNDCGQCIENFPSQLQSVWQVLNNTKLSGQLRTKVPDTNTNLQQFLKATVFGLLHNATHISHHHLHHLKENDKLGRPNKNDERKGGEDLQTDIVEGKLN